jgi:hypothetical protein
MINYKLFKDVFKVEHYFKIASSLYIFGTSIYDIKEDITSIKKEHGLLIIGIVSLMKVLRELFIKIRELKSEMF